MISLACKIAANSSALDLAARDGGLDDDARVVVRGLLDGHGQVLAGGDARDADRRTGTAGLDEDGEAEALDAVHAGGGVGVPLAGGDQLPLAHVDARGGQDGLGEMLRFFTYSNSSLTRCFGLRTKSKGFTLLALAAASYAQALRGGEYNGKLGWSSDTS